MPPKGYKREKRKAPDTPRRSCKRAAVAKLQSDNLPSTMPPMEPDAVTGQVPTIEEFVPTSPLSERPGAQQQSHEPSSANMPQAIPTDIAEIKPADVADGITNIQENFASGIAAIKPADIVQGIANIQPSIATDLAESKATVVTEIEEGDNISFAEAIAKLTGRVEPTTTVESSPKETFLLEDTSRRIVSSLPAQCGVTDVSLQDDLLKRDYIALLPLTAGQFKSWSDREGISTTRFSGWIQTCPKMQYKQALKAMRFVNDGRYINPSRISPTLLSARDTSINNSRYVAEVKVNNQWETAVFLTPVYVIQSHLYDHSREYKYITGVAHGQEWERMVAVICMIMHVDVLNAQVVGSELQFSTKPIARSTAYVKTQLGLNVMVNKSPSPALLRMKSKINTSRRDIHVDGTSSTFVRPVLEATDIIPVFDARDYSLSLDFTANQLSQLEETFPLFSGEIPEGSMAMIAYTVTYYYKEVDRSWNLSTNLQWVVVLGSPNV